MSSRLVFSHAPGHILDALRASYRGTAIFLNNQCHDIPASNLQNGQHSILYRKKMRTLLQKREQINGLTLSKNNWQHMEKF
jgi:hypothetical protein